MTEIFLERERIWILHNDREDVCRSVLSETIIIRARKRNFRFNIARAAFKV